MASMSNKKCGKCSKSIYYNDPQLALGGDYYHKSCARCATCNGQLSIKNFSTSGDRLLCKTHFKEEFAMGGGVYAGGDKFKQQPGGGGGSSSSSPQNSGGGGLVHRQSSLSSAGGGGEDPQQMMTTTTTTSNMGLVRRQSSMSPDRRNATDESLATATNIDPSEKDDVEMATLPLLTQTSSTATSGDNIISTESSSPHLVVSFDECFFIYGHMALSVLFLMAASSIVPFFRSAEDESWRTQNIPYQKLATSSGVTLVILDQRLNQPLIDPPTISSNLLINTCIVLPLVLVLFVNLIDFRRCLLLESAATTKTTKFMIMKPVSCFFKLPLPSYMSKSQLHELRAGVCGILVSTGLSEWITCVLKLYVSRPRPNFYQLCGFDTDKLACMAPALSDVREASLSFPSGHSSLSFSGMTFLVYYLRGRLALLTSTTTTLNSASLNSSSGGRLALFKIQQFLLPRYKSLLDVFCILGPWSYSIFVACSRIHDNWHHPDDVVAGILLGITAATIGYHAFYPSTTSSGASGFKAGIPLSLQQQ